MDGNEEPGGAGPEADPSVAALERGMSVHDGGQTDASTHEARELGAGDLEARVESLRRSEEARTAEVAALRAELAVAQQERERELTGLRAALDDARQGQLGAHRRAILAEYAGQIVEELVAGSTVAELDASLDRARAAYGRALESARRELGATVVPVGASPRLEPSPEELSPIGKIAAALSRR